ncbi:FMN-binding negative transcriptional regulator [Sphingosinicella terrae]|uniref:FMN-binding negative transcriptional regulator n=1 Tax=Sphingosinicella terrae TaxID=2172047 RepID=UPI0013B41015|nr:FMN-binding negative transcriptional regulator [Sphingosinicella terrae]
MTDPFAPRTTSDILRLIREHPLAWVVAADFQAAPLPLLAETDAEGGIAALFGHMSRANPLHESLRRDPRALILFSGPDAYISPRFVSDPSWGPTWNYAVVSVETEVELVPEETGDAVARLARHLEGEQPDAWTVEALGPRYQDLIARIIAFRAHVRRVSPRFKLGQDETLRVFGEIVQKLGDAPVAGWMRGQRGSLE